MDQPRAQESNQPTAKDGFGVHLRREREMRGVTLEEISSATRIGTRFLDALEAEQWEVLPGGVFNRGFVRSTAQFLGLDPEAMLAEYTLATTDSTRPAAPVMIHSQSSWTPRAATSSRDFRLTWIALIVIAAIAVGGWFGWKHYRAVRRARAADAALNTGAPDSTAVSPDANAAASAPLAAPNAQPPASQPSADSSPAPDTSASAAPTVPASANDAAAAPSDASSAPTAAATSSTAANSAAPSASAPTSASAPLVLKIEAGRSTSVRVSVDGHKTFSGKISAGSSKTFQANEVFYITARDAGGVLLELNGQTLPPLGPQGHSGSIRLTRETLKAQDGTNH
jgi:cytoskeleton protein RodZ